MNKKNLPFLPILFFLGLGFILFSPYLFMGKVPFPTSYIANNIGPWNRYLPNGPVKNGIPDVPGEIFPLRDLSINMWKRGILPLWNPYAFSGVPLLANFQSAVFFPLNLLFFLLPHLDAWSLLVLFQPLFAGFFTLLLLRNFRISQAGSLFGAVSFMFCGYLTVWGAYNTIGYAVLILPLALLIVDKFLTEKKIFYLPLLAFLLAFSFFSGHIQSWMYVILALFIYSLIKVILSRDKNNLPDFFLLNLTFFATLALVAIQLLPTFELYLQSGRLLVKNAYPGIPFYYFVTLLAPDFFGNPVTRNSWFGNYPEWSGYFGQIAFIFSLFSLFFVRKDKRIIPFVALGAIGLFLSLESPFLSFLTSLPIPIIGNSNPGRSIVLFSFAFSVLSGFGLDFFLKGEKSANKKISLPLFLFGGLLAFLTIISFFSQSFFIPPLSENLKIISLRNLILPVIFFILAFFAIFLSSRKKVIYKILPLILLSLLTLEMLRFYFKWQPFDSRSLFFKNTPVTDFLKKQPDYFRYHGFGQTPGLTEHIYGIEGYEPLNLLYYSNLINAAKEGKASNSYDLYVSIENRELYTKKILDLLGVKYFIYQSGDIGNPFKFPIWGYHQEGYKEIFNDGKFIVYQNPMAFPKVKAYNSYQVIHDRDKLLTTLLTSKADLTKTLFLNKDPRIAANQLGLGTVRIIKYSPNEIIINSQGDKPTLLFLNEIYYPGWQAFINNREEEILRVNYVFRGLVVPKGENNIRFVYLPNSYKIGMVITILAFIFIFSTFIFVKSKNLIL